MSESKTCREIQQFFYENLGNRKYDCFKSTEEKYLKLKIAYNLFGPPNNRNESHNFEFESVEMTVSNCYNQIQQEIIEKIFQKVIKYRKYFTEDRIIAISFMFNVCVLRNNKKSNNAQEKFLFPIFRVQKCFDSKTGQECCVYIDEQARVYENWNDYLKNNKIPKAWMVLPKNGKYNGDINNQVLLEQVLSPACSVANAVLTGTDITSSVIAVATGGIAIASIIPALTIAPVVLTGALITSAGVGLYSTIRSSTVLHDRRIHDESIDIRNATARGCYMNIATGITGVLTTGFTKATSIALGKGIQISENTATALLSVNLLNMGVAGCNVANSVYSVISDIMNKKTPSTIDILQLTTTVLFFGNAVVNLKSAHGIFQQTQSVSYAELVQNRSQYIWNRAKTLFLKSDATFSDNYSIKTINDTDDLCLNTLNAVINPLGRNDPLSNGILNKIELLLSNIEPVLKFGMQIINNVDNVRVIINLILSQFERQIQEVLIKLLKWLLEDVAEATFSILEQLFPKTEKLEIYLHFITKYLRHKVMEMEIEYQEKKAVDPKETEEFAKISGFRTDKERIQIFFGKVALKMITASGQRHEILFREMVGIFWDWLTEQSSTLFYNQDRITHRYYSKEPKNCGVCKGYYYIDFKIITRYE